MESDPWLTVEQVAERLQIHVDTVRRALRDGRMRGYKLSRKSGWRIRTSDADRYVTDAESLTAEDAPNGDSRPRLG